MYSLKKLDSFLSVIVKDYFKDNSACRLCFRKNAKISLKTDKKLQKTINECLNIDLSTEIGPQNICKKCNAVLKKFSNFRLYCAKTNDKLLDIFMTNNKELIKQEGCDADWYSCEIESGSPPPVPTEETTIIKQEQDKTQYEYNIKIENPTRTQLLINDTTNTQIIPKDTTINKIDTQTLNLESKSVKQQNKQTTRPNQLKYKMTLKHLYYCFICYKQFNENNFNKHNLEKHSINIGDYKCYTCDRIFKTYQARTKHELHSCKLMKLGYLCRACNILLPNRRLLLPHVRCHEEGKEYVEDCFKCRTCQVRFKSKTELVEHKKLHVSEKPKKKYVCEFCGTSFERHDYLSKHRKIHLGDKQYECDHCSLRFVQRSSLIMHLRKHTGERPFSCEFCPRRCVSSSNLLTHRRRHLNIKKYQCAVCTTSFGYKKTYENHLSSVHGFVVNTLKHGVDDGSGNMMESVPADKTVEVEILNSQTQIKYA